MAYKKTDIGSKPKKEAKASPEKEMEKEERAISLVLDDKKDSEMFYDKQFKSFNYFDMLYIKGAAKKNVPYGRANLELPLAFQQIEPFVDTMLETMTGEKPYLGYDGRNEEDIAAAEEITDYTQYQLDTGNFLVSYNKYLRNLGKYGTAAMKVAWETDILTVEEEKQITDPLEQIVSELSGEEPPTEPTDYTLHDGPTFYNISLFDIFLPKSASDTNVQKMEYVIHRTYRALEELLDNPNYKRAHKYLKQKLKERDMEYKDNKDNNGNIKDVHKRRSEDQKNPGTGTSKYAGKIEVLERWGDFRFDSGSHAMKPALIVVAVCEDDEILLRLDENPFKFKFKPFLISNDYPVDGEPYGYGELHHLKGLIEESTALRNSRLDVANLSLNRVWLVERQAGVNLRELYTAPNKIILTNDLQGIKPLDMGQVTASSVNELARIDFDIQNTTEIINPRQDVSNVGAAFGQTATGVSFMAGKSNARIKTKAKIQQDTFFKALAQMLNWYNRDLITDDQYYRVSGEEENPYRTLPADAFLTEVDFKPMSNPDKPSRAELKENMGYFLQTVGQVLKVKPDVNIVMEELIKDIAKISGLPHPDKYIGPPQTTILQTPDGQVVDQKGQPVNVVPVDENGQPIEQQGTPEGA